MLQRNTGTAAIFVKVQDVEDQPPEFVVVTPVARVSEDAPPGTSILQGLFRVIIMLYLRFKILCEKYFCFIRKTNE